VHHPMTGRSSLRYPKKPATSMPQRRRFRTVAWHREKAHTTTRTNAVRWCTTTKAMPGLISPWHGETNGTKRASAAPALYLPAITPGHRKRRPEKLAAGRLDSSTRGCRWPRRQTEYRAGRWARAISSETLPGSARLWCHKRRRHDWHETFGTPWPAQRRWRAGAEGREGQTRLQQRVAALRKVR